MRAASLFSVRCSHAIAVVAILLTVAACGNTGGGDRRPYPIGDPSAAARVMNPSASVANSRVARPIVPGQLYVPAIGVNTKILSLGTQSAPDPFLAGKVVTSFEVPPNLSEVGWWRDGAPVGGRAMAVILGHSQVGGRYAVFNRLAELQKGDTVTVEDETGASSLRFAVTRVKRDIPKSDESALQQALTENSASSQLALITCSGNFDSGVAESVDNTVAFAVRQ